MTKKPDDKKKISGVGSATKASAVAPTVGIDEVAATTAVDRVDKAGAIDAAKRRATSFMNSADRAKVLKMIDQEKDSLVKAGVLPKGKADLIAQSVKMAIDAGIIIKDDKDV